MLAQLGQQWPTLMRTSTGLITADVYILQLRVRHVADQVVNVIWG